jgi:hypothetical protein
MRFVSHKAYWCFSASDARLVRPNPYVTLSPTHATSLALATAGTRPITNVKTNTIEIVLFILIALSNYWMLHWNTLLASFCSLVYIVPAPVFAIGETPITRGQSQFNGCQFFNRRSRFEELQGCGRFFDELCLLMIGFDRSRQGPFFILRAYSPLEFGSCLTVSCKGVRPMAGIYP